MIVGAGTPWPPLDSIWNPEDLTKGAMALGGRRSISEISVY